MYCSVKPYSATYVECFTNNDWICAGKYRLGTLGRLIVEFNADILFFILATLWDTCIFCNAGLAMRGLYYNQTKQNDHPSRSD